jgi:hypothetical protein
MKLFSMFNNPPPRKEVGSTLSKSSSVSGATPASPKNEEPKTLSPMDSASSSGSNRRIVLLVGEEGGSEKCAAGPERRNSTTFEEVAKASNMKPTVVEAPRTKRAERKSVSLSFQSMAVRRQNNGPLLPGAAVGGATLSGVDDDGDAIGIDDDSDMEDETAEDTNGGGDHHTMKGLSGYGVSVPSSSSESATSGSGPSGKSNPLGKAPVKVVGVVGEGGYDGLSTIPPTNSTSGTAIAPAPTSRQAAAVSSVNTSSSTSSRISRTISGRFMALAQSVMPNLVLESSSSSAAATANVSSNLSEDKDSENFDNPNPMLARSRPNSSGGPSPVVSNAAVVSGTATARSDKGGGRGTGAKPPTASLGTTAAIPTATPSKELNTPLKVGVSKGHLPPSSLSKLTVKEEGEEEDEAPVDTRGEDKDEKSSENDKRGEREGEVGKHVESGGPHVQAVSTDSAGQEEPPPNAPASEDMAPSSSHSAPEKKPFQLVDRCLVGAAHNRDLGIALALPAAPKRATRSDAAATGGNETAVLGVAPPPPFGAASILKVHSAGGSCQGEGEKLHGIHRALSSSTSSGGAGLKGSAFTSSLLSHSNQGTSGKALLPPARPRKFAPHSDSQEKVGWG